jgi:hypothetical protein
MGEDKERLKGARKIKGGLNDRQRKKRSRNALDYERSSTESREKGSEEACEEADKESEVGYGTDNHRCIGGFTADNDGFGVRYRL